MHGTIAPQEFRPNPGQKRALALLGGEQTHTCLVGGSRSGKTFLAVRSLIVRALRAPGSRHLMVRFRANALRASVWLDTFPKVCRICFPRVQFTPHRMDGFVEVEGGSQIWGSGLDEDDRVEKILGQEYATIYGCECSQIPYSSILVLRTRLAQSGTGLKLRGIYDLNPTSTSHWTNLEFGEKRDPISLLPLKRPEQFERVFMNPEDNAENLDPAYIQSLDDLPEVYRLRFRDGVYQVEIDGALWTTDMLELCRDEPIEPDPSGKRLSDLRRVVVGVDPSGAGSKLDIKSDEIGVVACGVRHDGTGVLLEDASMRGSPLEWGRRAASTYRKWRADAIVAEANYGGAMVESTIRAADKNAKVTLVSASRGKVVRAEPVAALYENKKITHAGRFPELESQLTKFSKFGYKGDRSPDRADAAIWALSELMLGDGSTYDKSLSWVR
jgi:hypothetical protein